VSDPSSPFPPRSVFSRLSDSESAILLGAADEISLERGESLWRIGDAVDATYVVLDGRLEISGDSDRTDEVLVGEGLDELLLLTGGERTTAVTALDRTRLLRLRLDSVHELFEGHPTLLHEVSHVISRQLRRDQLGEALERLFGKLDREAEEELARRVEWLELAPGEALFRQRDAADALFVLMEGILAAWADADGTETFLNEIAAGETIGEIALIGGAPHSATVRAVKPSLLIRLRRADFEAIAGDHPIVYKAFAEVLVEYLTRSRAGRAHLGGAREITLLSHQPDSELSSNVARELAEALTAIGPTLHLSVARLHEMSDRFPFDVGRAVDLPFLDPANARFSTWLRQQRKEFQFVLYEADPDRTPWTRVCIDRADELVIVADSNTNPLPGPLESSLDRDHLVQRRLVLVHQGNSAPTNTHRWLSGRRLAGYHHVRSGRSEDFARLARFLAKQATGLVLAGGGARGFAHIGVIQALHDAGIPIDSIGGTSSGAMCSVMYAMELDPYRLAIRNQRDWVDRKPWNKYAPPVLSILDYTRWDRIFHDGYGDADIEDLWIPAYCVSSNIDAGRMVVHDSGPAWKAVRASASLPALLAPVLFDGQAHVDGGLLNNLPTDVMRARTAGPIFAVSLGQRTTDELPFDTYPSPWKLTAEMLNPFKRSVPMHTIPKVMLQIAVMGDLARADQRSGETDVVLEPPVSDISMTAFDDVKGIIRVGYDYTVHRLEALAHDEDFLTRMQAAGIAFPTGSQPGGPHASLGRTTR
jgi:predicted acylesterase/phospholipase RssA/CRP-like cAMP-binding protein